MVATPGVVNRVVDEDDRVGGWEELYVGATRKSLAFLREHLPMFLPEGRELQTALAWLDACDRAFRDYEAEMALYVGASADELESLRWKVNVGLVTEQREPKEWERRRDIRLDMIRCLVVLKQSADFLTWLQIHSLETNGHPLSELYTSGYIFWPGLTSAQRLASHAAQLRFSLSDVLVIDIGRGKQTTPRLLGDEPHHIAGVARADARSARDAWQEWGKKPAFAD